MVKDAISYLLGIDMGTNSIGWAVIDLDGKGKPCGIVSAGSRVFTAPVQNDSDIMSGKDSLLNANRREKRMRRRQLERRGRRKVKLLHTLMRHGLLPQGEIDNATARHDYFKALDNELYLNFAKNQADGVCVAPSSGALLPYVLRSQALNVALAPHEIGRAIYHLAQRRGFKSNRKGTTEDREEQGVVLSAIQDLETQMKLTGAESLGAYFASLDPHQQRIRGRWTARTMLEGEFAQIWEAQSEFNPRILNKDALNEIGHAIFDQRPLKSQKGNVGCCSLETGAHRAPMANLGAQRFRLLQKVNDLEIITPHGEVLPLDSEQRSILLDELEKFSKLKFSTIRKILGLKRNIKFNFELGGADSLPGNSTAARLRKIYGERWDNLTTDDCNQLVEDVLTIQNEEALVRRGMKAWGLSEGAAQQLPNVVLESGYMGHSLRAINRMLALMEEGGRYATVKKEIYPQAMEFAEWDELPPVSKALSDVRNPIVMRSLSELRKVVNQVVGKWGRPERIRVELARDLKRPRKERESISRKISKNEARRKDALKEIMKRYSGAEPSREDILRYLLAEECNWKCPYTNKPFGFEDLFGPTPRVDIEHIIPFSRCLDDSYTNKTLCDVEFNRRIKGKRTPFECLPEAERESVLDRVRQFKCDGRLLKAKLDRFKMEDVEERFEGFVARQLNDTRYAAKLAKEYLGCTEIVFT